MPIYFLHIIKASIFIICVIVLVPRREIRRLFVYGIIFGSMYDVIGLTVGHLTNAFRWINFGPFGYNYLPLDSPVSWCAFFIMYFYLLPKHKPLIYFFPMAGIVMSMIYSRVLVNLGMFIEPTNFVIRLGNFILWFTYATWGYFKLNQYIEKKHNVYFEINEMKNKSRGIYKRSRFVPAPQLRPKQEEQVTNLVKPKK